MEQKKVYASYNDFYNEFEVENQYYSNSTGYKPRYGAYNMVIPESNSRTQKYKTTL